MNSTAASISARLVSLQSVIRTVPRSIIFRNPKFFLSHRISCSPVLHAEPPDAQIPSSSRRIMGCPIYPRKLTDTFPGSLLFCVHWHGHPGSHVWSFRSDNCAALFHGTFHVRIFSRRSLLLFHPNDSGNILCPGTFSFSCDPPWINDGIFTPSRYTKIQHLLAGEIYGRIALKKIYRDITEIGTCAYACTASAWNSTFFSAILPIENRFNRPNLIISNMIVISVVSSPDCTIHRFRWYAIPYSSTSR